MRSTAQLFDDSIPKPQVPTKRPKGRTPGALPCNNPNIDYKDVRKRVRKFVTEKAFFGAVMEKAINNAHKIVHSEHTRAIHRSMYSHRTHLGINRDITAWIVLLSTVNLTAANSDNWFKCVVNLTRLDEIGGYESLSRGSRFLELFRKTDLLKVTYKPSKENRELKYCEIFISRQAFNLAGVTNVELDGEIDRKRRNDKKRLAEQGTREYEDARATSKTMQRHIYDTQRENRKRKKEQAKSYSRAKFEEVQNQTLKKQAVQVFTELHKEYPNKSITELKTFFFRKYPELALALGHSPPE